MTELPQPYRNFSEEYEDLWKAYEHVGAIAAEAGPLDIKTRELIKLGMAAARGSESAVISHTHRLLEIGARREEIEHALVLGVTTMGFPTMMAALTWAKSAIDQKTGS